MTRQQDDPANCRRRRLDQVFRENCGEAIDGQVAADRTLNLRGKRMNMPLRIKILASRVSKLGSGPDTRFTVESSAIAVGRQGFVGSGSSMNLSIGADGGDNHGEHPTGRP